MFTIHGRGGHQGRGRSRADQPLRNATPATGAPAAPCAASPPAVAVLVVMLLLALRPVAAAAGGFEEHVTLHSQSLVIANLAGEVEVEGSDGTAFEVEIRVRGEDATRDAVTVETTEGERGEIFIAYPVKRKTRFVYPGLGRHSSTNITIGGYHDDSLLERRLRKQGARRIKVSGGGRGLEMWADILVRVPDGANLRIELGVGAVGAEDVGGSLSADTWSGHVTAHGIRGDLAVDTGSGHVEASGVEGKVWIDTGSGHVSLRGCEGPRVSIDTGSGHVEVADIDTRRLLIDTGSGQVSARAVRAGRARIDTGSGRVELELDALGAGPFVVDTGSGSVSLRLPAGASATIEAETGSGGIRVDADDARVLHREEDAMTVQLGEGDAEFTLDTGSGSISISTR